MSSDSPEGSWRQLGGPAGLWETSTTLTGPLKSGKFCPKSWIFFHCQEAELVLDGSRKAFHRGSLDLALNPL